MKRKFHDETQYRTTNWWWLVTTALWFEHEGELIVLSQAAGASRIPPPGMSRYRQTYHNFMNWTSIEPWMDMKEQAKHWHRGLFIDSGGVLEWEWECYISDNRQRTIWFESIWPLWSVLCLVGALDTMMHGCLHLLLILNVELFPFSICVHHVPYVQYIHVVLNSLFKIQCYEMVVYLHITRK